MKAIALPAPKSRLHTTDLASSSTDAENLTFLYQSNDAIIAADVTACLHISRFCWHHSPLELAVARTGEASTIVVFQQQRTRRQSYWPNSQLVLDKRHFENMLSTNSVNMCPSVSICVILCLFVFDCVIMCQYVSCCVILCLG